jgi:hypothetical protein
MSSTDKFIPPDEVFNVRCPHPSERIFVAVPNPPHEELFSRAGEAWLPTPTPPELMRVCGDCRQTLGPPHAVKGKE